MKTRYAAISCLVIGSLVWTIPGLIEKTHGADSAAPRPGDKALTSPQQADDATASAVRGALMQSINSALTENRFSSLITHLAKPDGDRIGTMEGEKFDDLNKTIARFREDFRAKYRQEFDLRPEQLKAMTITFGLDKKAVSASLNELDIKPPASAALPPVLKPTGEPAKDIVAGPGLSVVNGPMVNLVLEGSTAAGVPNTGQWKIDIPNEITGRQLKENLTRHLQRLDDQKSTWPDDVNAAYHAAASQVLQALSDSTLASEK